MTQVNTQRFQQRLKTLTTPEQGTTRMSHHADKWTEYELLDKSVEVIFHAVNELTEAQ